MDLITLLTAIPAIGPFLPYILVAGAVASAIATILPAPTVESSKAYASTYRIVNWLALNVGKAKNAIVTTVPAPKAPTGTAAILLALILAPAVLSGCTSTQLATSTAVAPVAVSVASASSPTVASDIAKACQIALPIAQIAPVATAGGAQQTATAISNLVTSSCTGSGPAQLTANDAAPVTATNSGNSAAWLSALTTALQVVQAVAPVAEAL